jgi:hypothetical protein
VTGCWLTFERAGWRAWAVIVLLGEMKPIAARVLITVIVLAFVIVASVFVNSRFHGSFAAGIILLVLPFLALSFSLPYLLPVRCPKCSGKMRFHFFETQNRFAADVRLRLRAMHSTSRVGRRVVRQLAR